MFTLFTVPNLELKSKDNISQQYLDIVLFWYSSIVKVKW